MLCGYCICGINAFLVLPSVLTWANNFGKYAAGEKCGFIDLKKLKCLYQKYKKMRFSIYNKIVNKLKNTILFSGMA